mmetsp:Transcript_5747/g.18134  ORF Transcript_5747/g.18134 Transcript_5747/m.18134 type:complete len:125 (-) Transcript_5747:181-555(-)
MFTVLCREPVGESSPKQPKTRTRSFWPSIVSVVGELSERIIREGSPDFVLPRGACAGVKSSLGRHQLQLAGPSRTFLTTCGVLGAGCGLAGLMPAVLLWLLLLEIGNRIVEFAISWVDSGCGGG